MTKKEIIRNLKYTMEKHKNDRVDTFGTNILLMCKDILDYLEKEPCGKDINVPATDCISRQEVRKTMTREEAIKQLNKLKSFHNGSYGEALNFAIESIKVDMAYDLAYEKSESEEEK